MSRSKNYGSICRAWPVGLVFGLLSTSGVGAAAGLPQGINTIAEVRADLDRDGIPDRLGQQVTVRGIATIDSTLLHAQINRYFIQDGSGGIQIYDDRMGPVVQQGHHLLVQGKVGHYRGLTQLESVHVEILGTPLPLPQPRSLPFTLSAFEKHEGMLVAVFGYVVGIEATRGGHVLDITDNKTGGLPLSVFISHEMHRLVNPGRFSIGDHVEARGILSQYDRQAPYKEMYQLLPRQAGDLVAHGITRRQYRYALWGGGGLLVLCLTWMAGLHSKVKLRTREALESSRQFHLIYEHSMDPLFLLDYEANIINVNPSGCALMCTARAKLLGRPFHECFREAYRQPVEGAVSITRRLGRGELEMVNCLDQSGRIDVDLRLKDFYYSRRKRVLAVVRDITERKVAEESLKAEKERLSVTLASIHDGVITTNCEGRVVLANRSVERLTGWTVQESIDQPLEKIIQLKNSSTYGAGEDPVNWLLHPPEAPVRPAYGIIKVKGGDERAISIISAPIHDNHGLPAGVVVVFEDISAKVKIEEEMNKASRLESIGLLAGGIAHDFNNILTVIKGNLSLAQSDPDLPDAIKEDLAEADKATGQARELTQQLLTFSKGGTPVKKPIYLRKLIRESAAFATKGANVDLSYALPEALWPVEGDAGQLRQVIHNLVLNAKESMPDGGKISIRGTNFISSKEVLKRSVAIPPGEYVCLTVTDEGAGISVDEISRVFDPYFTTKDKGSGLGLATSYSILKNHGGVITVNSEPGAGTTFSIYLPATHRAVVSDADMVETVVPGSGLILIMDDEPGVLQVTSAMLRRAGYSVKTALEGRAALALYAHARESGNPFDAVILDLTIRGGMGGKETIQKLRAMDPGVKALVASGYSNDPVMSRYREAGFDGMLPKPFTAQQLTLALQAVLRVPEIPLNAAP